MHENLSILKERDRLAIEEFYSKLVQFLNIRLISARLYGSKIKGTDSFDSDIDIFIVVSDTGSNVKNKVIDLAFEVNLKYDVYISPRVVPLNLFNDYLFYSTPFVRSVKEESLLL